MLTQARTARAACVSRDRSAGQLHKLVAPSRRYLHQIVPTVSFTRAHPVSPVPHPELQLREQVPALAQLHQHAQIAAALQPAALELGGKRGEGHEEHSKRGEGHEEHSKRMGGHRSRRGRAGACSCWLPAGRACV